MVITLGITLLVGIGLGVAMGVPMGRLLERVRPARTQHIKRKKKPER